MSTSVVTYELNDGIATIRIDDGKRNALGTAVLQDIAKAFERAEADQAAVILTGRDSIFSAGFDLKTMRGGKPAEALKMLHAGFSLPARILAHPYPVVAACNGHVLAMGVFMMLSADYILGTRGHYKVSANEVAIGLTMPRVGAAMLKHRLTPACFQRAVLLSEYFPVEQAQLAGFFDEILEADELMARARELIHHFRELDMPALAGSKRRIRGKLMRQLQRSAPLDVADAAMLGLKGRKKG